MLGAPASCPADDTRRVRVVHAQDSPIIPRKYRDILVEGRDLAGDREYTVCKDKGVLARAESRVQLLLEMSRVAVTEGVQGDASGTSRIADAEVR